MYNYRKISHLYTKNSCYQYGDSVGLYGGYGTAPYKEKDYNKLLKESKRRERRAKKILPKEKNIFQKMFGCCFT